MPKKTLDHGKKVEAMRRCLCLRNVKEVMTEYGFSERSAYYWFNKILEHLPEVLENKKPGRKSQRSDEAASPF